MVWGKQTTASIRERRGGLSEAFAVVEKMGREGSCTGRQRNDAWPWLFQESGEGGECQLSPGVQAVAVLLESIWGLQLAAERCSKAGSSFSPSVGAPYLTIYFSITMFWTWTLKSQSFASLLVFLSSVLFTWVLETSSAQKLSTWFQVVWGWWVGGQIYHGPGAFQEGWTGWTANPGTCLYCPLLCPLLTFQAHNHTCLKCHFS